MCSGGFSYIFAGTRTTEPSSAYPGRLVGTTGVFICPAYDHILSNFLNLKMIPIVVGHREKHQKNAKLLHSVVLNSILFYVCLLVYQS